MIHPDALALIKRFEGLRLEPYLCAAGVPTIGYGATVGVDGKPVKFDHPPIDEATAETLLQRDVARFERGVDRLVRVPLADTQRGALVSFSFNLGLGALQASTLLRRVNDHEWDEVPAQFLRWTRARGRVLPGLVARRAAEAELWCRHTGGRQHTIGASVSGCRMKCPWEAILRTESDFSKSERRRRSGADNP